MTISEEFKIFAKFLAETDIASIAGWKRLVVNLTRIHNPWCYIGSEENTLLMDYMIHQPEKIPSRAMTERNMRAKGGHGRTGFHVACAIGYLTKIPSEWITPHNLLIGDFSTLTPLSELAIAGHLTQVPTEILRQSLCGEQLDQHRFFSCPSFHLAAGHGHLDQIPEDMLTEENLGQEAHAFDKRTVWHVAAMAGNLCQLPQRLLTEKYLINKVPVREFGEAQVTVYECGANPEVRNQFLGIHIPSQFKEVFGAEWWKTNQDLLNTKSNMKNSMQSSTDAIELF